MNLNGKKIVLIGGAGFIGSHTLDLLVKENVKEILIFDNFSRGSLDNISHHLKNPRVSIFDEGGDVTHFDILNEALKGADIVFHFAALWLLHCDKYVDSSFEVNIKGTMNVLKACVYNNIKKLIFSSSASVYGDPYYEPIDENHPLNSKNFYGATKISSEAMINSFYYKYGLKSIILRYMNVFGIRQDYKGAYVAVIHKMLDAIENGEGPIIIGNGKERFDFINVKDCALANLLAAKSKKFNSCYNVGTGNATSLNEIASLLLKLKKKNYKINFKKNLNTTLVRDRVSCIKKIHKELGFLPNTNISNDLMELISWRLQQKS